MDYRQRLGLTRVGSAAWLLGALSLGCSGSGGGAAGSKGEAAQVPRDTDTSPPMQVPACGGAITPGPSGLRRLSNQEFMRSVRDVLHLADSEAEQALALLEPEGESRILAPPGVVSATHLEKYMKAAFYVADVAVSTPERRAALALCDLAKESCYKFLASSVGTALYRQALSKNEIDNLDALASTPLGPEPDLYRPAKLIIAGILSSSRFLFRVEDGTLPGKLATWNKLSSAEIATRLSFLIWGTNPDAYLTELALEDKLGDIAQVQGAARAMLEDPRASEGLGRLLSKWLELDEVKVVPRPLTQFPEWSDAKKASAIAEVNLFLRDFWVPAGANLLDALSARYSYVDDNLAPIYGLPPTGKDLAKIELPEERTGLLTQPGFLTASVPGASETVTPILRGKFLRNAFLCTIPVPGPPAMIPAVSNDPSLTVRERLASHRSSAECAACHQLLEPLGFGLEQYDEIGRFHATGSRGEALTGAGQAYGLGGDPGFVGPKELAALLQAAPEVADCVATKAFQFAYGREVSAQDACSVAQASTALKTTNFNLKDMILTMVTSDAFRFTSAATAVQP
ncbi:MAG: DUF1592 domain-containing protein [Polyangiaceae bacterium]|nr:DUF1592 domain-containing protein [Polyangiaceae bacterium]